MAGLFRFHQVFQNEIDAINERRKLTSRRKVTLKSAGDDREGHPVYGPTPNSNLVGLALSGGGVRSASFCLGVMQALDDAKVMDKVDYLSTVSGGGYIGTSLVAAMSESKDHKFPFPSELEPDETPSLRHVRDHSNYLFPRGKVDVFNNLSIYLRGLMANVILILPFLLLAAVLTISINPTVARLTDPQVFGKLVPVLFEVRYFGITLHLALFIAGLLAFWALARVLSSRLRDVGTGWTAISATALLGLLFSFFCELQPVALDAMFELAKNELAKKESTWGASIISSFKYLSATLAAFGAAVGFLAPYLGKLLKKGAEDPAWSARFGRIVAKITIYIAAAAVPLALWAVYLYLSYWGICGDPTCSGQNPYAAPEWIRKFSIAALGPTAKPVLYIYLAVAAALLVIGAIFTFRPNANSLHRLYRDRLSKAFLFNPDFRESDVLARFRTKPAAGADIEVAMRSRDLRPLDELKLSDVRHQFAPYQIINTALNIQGSRYANQRGRNADFFVFTPQFTGSNATYYVPTKDMEDRAPDLDLGAAMAISGAAASSNMGGNTIRILSPTLAILNVRLGFWLRNPLWMAKKIFLPRFYRFFDQLYFLKEMISYLNEKDSWIYLSDGGHIENLGIYELLRRRCQLIIAVDAEADPKMNFNSFVALQRYALIDLGVLVRLPWSKIRDATKAASSDIVATGGKAPVDAAHGPHCALGTIEYPDGGQGILLYVKSSLTGDENDYIVDYKRRYPDFPHETTADQLFSEEQFEAYRALGFHAMRRALRRGDSVAVEAGLVGLGGRAPRTARDRLAQRAMAILNGRNALK